MPRINQLPTASSVAQTDVLAIDTPEKTYQVPRSVLAPAPYIATIPRGQWSGSGSDRYITVTASNVTADAMLYPFYDNASAALLNGPVWVIPAAGSFTIHTSAIPSGTVTISVLLAGIVGEAQYQVLADVYSKSQVDTIVSQSTAIVYGVGTNIPSNSNFNNYTSPGAYSVASQVIAESITNIPYRQAGRLEVRGTLSTYIIQYYYPYTNVNRFYMRRYTNAWSDWYEYDDVTQTTAFAHSYNYNNKGSTVNMTVTGPGFVFIGWSTAAYTIHYVSGSAAILVAGTLPSGAAVSFSGTTLSVTNPQTWSVPIYVMSRP